MGVRRVLKPFWPAVWLAVLLVAAPAAPAGAASAALRSKPDADVLTLTFDSGSLPAYSLKRTGKRQLTLALPRGFWESERPPAAAGLRKGKLLASVEPGPAGLVISVKTNAFGYLAMPVVGEPRLVIHVFRDPFGARWGAEPAKRPAPAPVPVKPVPVKPAPAPRSKKAAPAPDRAAGLKESQLPETAAETVAEPASPAGPDRPFFSVPYSVREKVRGGDSNRTAAQEAEPRVLEGGEVRFSVTRDQGDFSGPVGGRPRAVELGPGGLPELRFKVAQRPAAEAPAVPAPETPVPAVPALEAPANATAPEAPAPEAADNATAAGDKDRQAQDREKDFRDRLYVARSLMANGDMDGARTALRELAAAPGLPREIMEEVLYSLADVYRQIYANTLADDFDKVSAGYLAAMNYDLKSDRVPEALLNLGLINLKVGNLPEALGYFKTLTDGYPTDQNIPYIGYYWGEYYFDKGDYKKAADHFQELIQKYPDNPLAKRAAYLLAQALNERGYYKQAFQIVDYIDKRWAQFYLENPAFLKLAGDVESRLDKFEQAKEHYWTYYNLNPEAEAADLVLARIGDIYLRLGDKVAAKEIYQKAIKDFPDHEGGLVAKMRLAEEGIHDDPSVTEMVTVFDRPYNLRPKDIYTEIIDKHPDSPLASLALLKLAMWYSFHEDYAGALSAVQDLLDRRPDSPLAGRARELGDKSFALAVPQLVEDDNYARVVKWWLDYRFMDKSVDDETRLGVALSFWKIGRPAEALDILSRYLGRDQVPGFSSKALDLAVNIFLDEQNWTRLAEIVSLAKESWKLEPRQERQLEYARAMALENLGDSGENTALWAKLAKDMELDPAFRAYAMYYMAKAAMGRQDLHRTFAYSQEALSLLLNSAGDPEKVKDCVVMSIYSTERSGRYEEALKWAKAFNKYIPEDNEEWPSARFKLAQIYRKAGDVGSWLEILRDIVAKKPETLYGRLALSAVQTYELEQKAQQFAPAP